MRYGQALCRSQGAQANEGNAMDRNDASRCGRDLSHLVRVVPLGEAITMSKVEWAVLASIIGVVVVSIAAEPDHEEMAGHNNATMAMEATATSHTVALAVSGMT